MRSFHGYESYRGRSAVQTLLKVIIAVLLVVLLLLVGGYYLLENYVVYTDDGTARLELPFLKEREQEEYLPEPENDEVVVIVTDTPEPTPTPVPQPEELRAVSVPLSALLDGTAAAVVQQAGGNAAWFDMKTDGGPLSYVSQLPAAVDMGTSGHDPAVNEALLALNAGDLYTVARVSCFRDHLAPHKNYALSVKTPSGYNWWDDGDFRWLDITLPEVRDYVAGICGELAALGFDELVLDFAGYPVDGTLNTIKGGEHRLPENRMATVDAFYQQVKQTVEAVSPEIRLSIVTSPAVLSGEDDQSGQTLAQLTAYAHRICLAAPETGTCAELLSGAGLEAAQLFLMTPPADFVYDPATRTLPPDVGGMLLPAMP